MDLSSIVSISGKPGLFNVLGQMKNGIIVESLLDGKRFPAYASHKISTLEDISIYTEEEDIPLKDVFRKIRDKESGAASAVTLSDNGALKSYFEEVLPDYDRDRVYVSDIKKVIKWYNLLAEKSLLEETEESDDGIEDAEVIEEETTASSATEETSTEEVDASHEEGEVKDTEVPEA